MSTTPLPVKVFDSKVHESLVRFIHNNTIDIHVYRFALYNFVINNLKMRYRRSSLGFLWSLLNPLMTMAVISVVFSLIYRQDIRTFSIYIFSGLAPWSFLSATVQAGSMSLVYAEGFLKKVYLPKLLFPLITVSTEAVNFLFSLVSMYILALLLGAPVSWHILLLPLAVLVTFVFALGMVMIISVATVYFRDLTQIVSVVLTMLFYTVPVIYPIEQIPQQFQWVFTINPFFYFIMLFRKVIYYQTQPFTAADWLIPLGIDLLVVLIGFAILMKNDRDIIYRL